MRKGCLISREKDAYTRRIYPLAGRLHSGENGAKQYGCVLLVRDKRVRTIAAAFNNDLKWKFGKGMAPNTPLPLSRRESEIVKCVCRYNVLGSGEAYLIVNICLHTHHVSSRACRRCAFGNCAMRLGGALQTVSAPFLCDVLARDHIRRDFIIGHAWRQCTEPSLSSGSPCTEETWSHRPCV